MLACMHADNGSQEFVGYMRLRVDTEKIALPTTLLGRFALIRVMRRAAIVSEKHSQHIDIS